MNVEEFKAAAVARLKEAKKRPDFPKDPKGSWDEVGRILGALYAEATADATKAPSGRKRNALLDALCAVCGSNPLELTKSSIRAAGVALADIKSVCPNVTQEEIEARAAEYRRKHRDWPLTPPALAKHWASCGGGPRTHSAKADIYCEPPNWQPTAADLLGVPLNAFTGKEWGDLGPDTRIQILRRISA